MNILSAEAEPSAYLNQNRLDCSTKYTNPTDQLHLKLDSQEASNKKGTELPKREAALHEFDRARARCAGSLNHGIRGRIY